MNLLETLAATIAHNSLRASLFIACVLLLRFVLHGRMPARIMHLLWVLAAVRLLLPAAPASGWSVFNLFTPGASVETVAARGWQVRTEPAPRPSVAPSLSTEKALPVHLRESATPFPWLPALWLGGVAIQAALLAGAALTLRRRLRGSAEIREPRVLEAARRCAAETGVRGGLRVFETETVSGPAVAGILRPRVLLPTSLHARLSDEELRFVLLHECLHLRRHDLAAMWLLTIARVIHWFNPFVWLAERMARTDAELACDEAVLRHDEAPEAYGQTLLRLAQSVPRPRPALFGVGIVEGRSDLRIRISRIGNPARRTPVRTVFAALAAGAVVIAFGADEKDVAHPAQKPAATASEEKLESAEPDWAKGWSVVRIAIPSSGNIKHAFVDLKSPEGRAVTLSEGVTSKEGVTLWEVEWTGSPVRAHIVLTHGEQRAELFADAGIVARDDGLTPRSAQIEIEGRFVEVTNAVLEKTPALKLLRDMVSDGDTNRISESPISKIAGALKPKIAEMLIRELGKTKGMDLLSAPRVTTKAGQRAVIE
ncbi:MAG: M56 family metallopeptidase, partial [Chthoniobacteraceae bacterium]